MQTVFRRKFSFDVDCENWGLFFKTLITNLKPGRFGNQTFQFQTKKNHFKFVNVSTKQLIDNNAKQTVNIWRRKEKVFDWVRLVFILIHFHFFAVLILYDVFWSRFRFFVVLLEHWRKSLILYFFIYYSSSLFSSNSIHSTSYEPVSWHRCTQGGEGGRGRDKSVPSLQNFCQTC